MSFFRGIFWVAFAATTTVTTVVFVYPKLAARICRAPWSWTTDKDFFEGAYAVYGTGGKGIFSIRTTSEGKMVFGLEGDGVALQAWPLEFNSPLFLEYGDTYPGSFYLPLIGSDGLSMVFFDECGKVLGALH